MPDDPLDLLERLIAVPSVTGGEGPYAALVAEVLSSRGFAVTRDEVAPGRPNLVAVPASGARPRVWFSTHLDVVPPHLPPRREGDVVWGRGAADTKGPLVAMLAAARALGPDAPVGFLLVVGEEVDHCGARAAAAAAARLGVRPERILLGEPTSNRVVLAQRGLLRLRVEATGRAGHSAFPDRGVSAVHRLLDWLDALRRAAPPDDPVLGRETVNVGRLEGGVAANVFAPSAVADVLARLVTPVDEALARLRGPEVEGVTVTVVSHNDPVRFVPPPGFETCVIPFNTDASYLSPLGPVWLCGPGAIEVAHSPDERIARADLEEGARTYQRLAEAALA